MFRLFFTWLLPLTAPTLFYFAWKRVQARRAEAAGKPLPLPTFAEVPWLVLVGAGVSLVLVSLLAFALFGRDGGAPGSVYTPAHYENGRIVPGETR